MDYNPSPMEEDAKFNMGLAILERINGFHNAVASNLMTWNLMDAFFSLEYIETEIEFKLKDDEKKELKEIKEKIVEMFNTYNHIGEVVNNKPKFPMQSGELRTLLVLFDRSLRKYLNKYGFMMPAKGESRLF